jgi:hypothetical protein
MVLASSADAAPPAKALPVPLPLCSISANPDAPASPAASPTNAPPTANATHVLLNCFIVILLV